MLFDGIVSKSRLPGSGGSVMSVLHRGLHGLDLQQPDEQRLVLLLEPDDVEDAEPLVAAGDDLLAGLDHHRVGRLSEIVPVRRMELVLEHISSDPGPDGVAEAISGANVLSTRASSQQGAGRWLRVSPSYKSRGIRAAAGGVFR